MAEQRELSGVLSRNKKRETDRQPEFKGSATIDGVAYWLSGWVKEGDDGKFFSLAFTRKEQQPKSETRPQASPECEPSTSTPAGRPTWASMIGASTASSTTRSRSKPRSHPHVTDPPLAGSLLGGRQWRPATSTRKASSRPPSTARRSRRLVPGTCSACSPARATRLRIVLR